MWSHCKVIISSFSQKSRVPYGGNPSAAWEQATNAKFSINAVIIGNKTRTLFYSDCFCLGRGIEVKGEKNYSETIKETFRFVKFHKKNFAYAVTESAQEMRSLATIISPQKWRLNTSIMWNSRKKPLQLKSEGSTTNTAQKLIQIQVTRVLNWRKQNFCFLLQ